VTDQEIVEVAKKHQKICFMCKWIVYDFSENCKLTGYPINYDGSGEFPRDSKEKHAQLELSTT
jgi:hypothetical protein